MKLIFVSLFRRIFFEHLIQARTSKLITLANLFLRCTFNWKIPSPKNCWQKLSKPRRKKFSLCLPYVSHSSHVFFIIPRGRWGIFFYDLARAVRNCDTGKSPQVPRCRWQISRYAHVVRVQIYTFASVNEKTTLLAVCPAHQEFIRTRRRFNTRWTGACELTQRKREREREREYERVCDTEIRRIFEVAVSPSLSFSLSNRANILSPLRPPHAISSLIFVSLCIRLTGIFFVACTTLYFHSFLFPPFFPRRCIQQRETYSRSLKSVYRPSAVTVWLINGLQVFQWNSRKTENIGIWSALRITCCISEDYKYTDNISFSFQRTINMQPQEIWTNIY